MPNLSVPLKLDAELPQPIKLNIAKPTPISHVPTVWIQHMLAANPDTKSFPLGIPGYGPNISRADLQAELNRRDHIENKVMGLNAVMQHRKRQ